MMKGCGFCALPQMGAATVVTRVVQTHATREEVEGFAGEKLVPKVPKSQETFSQRFPKVEKEQHKATTIG